MVLGGEECKDCIADDHCGENEPFCGPQQGCVQCLVIEHCPSPEWGTICGDAGECQMAEECEPGGTPCPENLACYVSFESPAGAGRPFWCAPPGGGRVGDPCDTWAGCESGLWCHPDGEVCAGPRGEIGCCGTACGYGLPECEAPLSCDLEFDVCR